MAVWKENGVWVFKITVTDAYGKQRQIKRQSKTWSKPAAVRAEKDAMLEFATGSGMMFSTLSKEYMERKKRITKKSSYLIRDSILRNHILPTFGQMALDRITVKHIMAWQNELMAKELTNDYIQVIQWLMKSMLDYACDHNYILKNPFVCEYVKHIEERKKEEHVLSVTEFNEFMEYVDDPMFETLYTLLFWGGLRIGEALALTIGDYDSEPGTLNIDKTLSPTTHIITTPKSKNSYRCITLSQTVRRALDAWIGVYANLPDYAPERFIFGYDKPMGYTTINFRHQGYVKSARMEYFKIHSLRHSCVSVLISLGVKPLQIAKRMGHTVNMVNTTYGHLFQDDDKLIAEMQENVTFSKVLGRIKN